MASNHEILKTPKWLLRNYTILNIHFMCWNYIKMFYWCNLSPPQMLWSWLQDTDELVLIAGEKAIRTKKWRVTFEDDLLRHLALPPAMFLLRQKLISLRHGGWVVFASQLSPRYIIIDLFQREEQADQYTVLQALIPKQREWNQTVHTWLQRWNHTGWVQGVHVGSNRSESVCLL